MLICLNKNLYLDDVIAVMREKLDRGGTVTFTPMGNSMYPMLRDGEDTVILSKPKGRLKLFDIPLYKRSDGSYILHRIVDFDINGDYIMCGDNQFALERGIKDENIIAVVTAFYRKGKPYTENSPSYRLYINFWYYTRHIRHIFSAVKNRAVKSLGIRGKKKGNKNEEKSE